MKKFILIGALLGANAFAQSVGSDLTASPENVSPAFHQEEKEQAPWALNYVNQPPMVPHKTQGYQVTKNVNQCLQCHSPQNARITGATRISATHFKDRNGNVSSQTSPSRYFCLQCHVSQRDVEPLVPNDFQPLPGYGQ